jgi:hypothetical protein
MRRWVWSLVAGSALIVGPATVAEATSIGLDLLSDTTIFAVGDFHNIGWQFTVNAPITVDGLGMFDVNAAGLGEAHQVGLWNNSGTLLAQTTITNASTFVSSVSNSGDWLFNSIAPIVLAPGTYVTSAFYATNADLVMADSTITTIPQISFLAPRLSAEAFFAEAGVFGSVERGVFGADIRVSDVSVPEPVTLLLLGSGLAGLALTLRRRTTRSS